MGSVEAALKTAAFTNGKAGDAAPWVERMRMPHFGTRITDHERSEFCTQLAVMLQARVSLHRSLEVLALQTRNERMKRVIEEIGADLRRGTAFDRALAAHPEVFGNLFVVTCEVGQESGRLPEVLMHLAHHLEKMNALGRKVRQALAYPALVLSVALIVVTFLMLFVVPTFAEMFKNFKIELPASTEVILSVSRFLDAHTGAILGGIAGLGWVAFVAARDSSIRSWIEQMSLRIPLVGAMVVKTHVARFCRTLGTLLEAQVSLVEALEVTERITTNAGLRGEIAQIVSDVKGGHAIARPLEGSRLFPPMVVQMVAVGEETSELDAMLLKVADYFEKEIDASVELLSSVIEPVIILFLGMVVAGILVAMYLPMFELVNLVGVM